MTMTMQTRYATLASAPGMAVLLGSGEAWFLSEQEAPVRLTDADVPRLVLLGAVAVAEAQRYLDTLRGGAAAIACARS